MRSDEAVALVERYRGRLRCAHPDVARLELGQEFEPDRARGEGGKADQYAAAYEGEPAMGQHDLDDSAVDPPQPAHDERLGLRHLLRQHGFLLGARDQTRA